MENTYIYEHALDTCPDMLKPKDLQRIMQLSRNTVYRLLDTKKIKSIRIGRCYRIPKAYLKKFIYEEKNDDE